MVARTAGGQVSFSFDGAPTRSNQLWRQIRRNTKKRMLHAFLEKHDELDRLAQRENRLEVLFRRSLHAQVLARERCPASGAGSLPEAPQ